MAKGGNFEREIAKLLSKWWTAGEDDSIFWRTSNSGGRMTVRARKGLSTSSHCGDLCAINPIGEPLIKAFAIEIKRGYKGASIADLIDSPDIIKNIHYESWIEQAIAAQVASSSVFWMIIHRRDQRESTVTLPQEVFSPNWISSSLLTSRFCSFMRSHWVNRHTDVATTLIHLRLEDFLRFVSPDNIRKDILGME